MAGLVLSGVAHAGLISIDADTLSGDGAELVPSGTLVYAWNSSGNAVGTPTVNGISFSNTQPGDVGLAGFPAAVQDATDTENAYSGDVPEIMGARWPRLSAATGP